MGYPRFQYGGFSFMLVDPWLEYWAEDWYAPTTFTSTMTMGITFIIAGIRVSGWRLRSYCSHVENGLA
jgi:hypothetical protein